MKPQTVEVNFDGIVGPSHNYAGLSYGNIASMSHEMEISYPKEAALQGLRKMKLLHDLGVKQAVLPPHDRPHIDVLRRVGFQGSDENILMKVRKESPSLLWLCYSASSMWAANSATVSPRSDTSDNRTHFTPANLATQFHRSIEQDTTSTLLKAIFKDEDAFVHHRPIPQGSYFCDEGAANHMRLCGTHGEAGIEIFVYGRESVNKDRRCPSIFPARQTLEASHAVARLHTLSPERTLFAQQAPEAIDSGVFHNDVIAMSNENLFLYHASAYVHRKKLIDEIRKKFSRCSTKEPIVIEIGPEQVSVDEAVQSYMFNSQLVTFPDGTMSLIAPVESEENPSTKACFDQIISDDNPIKDVQYVDIRQSMKNGGGPACLRLRVVLTQNEISLVHQGIFMTEDLYQELLAWIDRYYRDRLQTEDLSDPQFMEEGRRALDRLTEILQLGSIYPFQKTGA